MFGKKHNCLSLYHLRQLSWQSGGLQLTVRQISIGRWFKSGSKECFFVRLQSIPKYKQCVQRYVFVSRVREYFFRLARISSYSCCAAVMAEWLRRLTRNQIPSGSVGSSPTDCETFILNCTIDQLLNNWRTIQITLTTVMNN